MVNATWKSHPVDGEYGNKANWSSDAVPDGTATFGKSSITAIHVNDNDRVLGEWVFGKSSSNYRFEIGETPHIDFIGDGIVNKGGAKITINSDCVLSFENSEGGLGNAHFNIGGPGNLHIEGSADRATIVCDGFLTFAEGGSAGHAKITANDHLSFAGFAYGDHASIKAFDDAEFSEQSHAGFATILNHTSTSMRFTGFSSASSATITNETKLYFYDSATAHSAHILNSGNLEFHNSANTGDAVITTFNAATLSFYDASDGSLARLITKAGGEVDFFGISDANIFVGSIEGAGEYFLGHKQLTVGGNDRSTTVTGLISGSSGSGDALVKTGKGVLKLAHANNTYSDGTLIKSGTVDVAALNAAGTGDIQFDYSTPDRKTLAIENNALDHHQFTLIIHGFDENAVIDLKGLKFVKGAKATYDDVAFTLSVKSGGVTDVLILTPDFDTHFKAVSDGHGGTKVVLAPPGRPAAHDDSFAHAAGHSDAGGYRADGGASHPYDHFEVANSFHHGGLFI